MWFVNLLTGGLLKQVLGFFQNWQNNELVKYQTGVNADTTIIGKQIEANVELSKVNAQLVAADKGWWVTAYMKPAAFYISLAHYGSVVADSLPWLGHRVGSFGVPALPGMYAGMEEAIILACVGIVGLKGVARIFTSK